VKIVGVTDLFGGTCNPKGLDVEALLAHEAKHKTVGDFKGGKPLTNEAFFKLEVDCLIPAAAGDVIHSHNASQVKARLIVEAANMPITLEGMDILQARGIHVVPDILANAGGVIASMLEYSSSLSAIKPTKQAVLETCTRKIGDNFDLAVERAKEQKISVTEAAVAMATERVYKVMKSRRMI